jgi:hypothetical protein
MHSTSATAVGSACAPSGEVAISPGRPPDTKLPDYGFGTGPAYLTGQIDNGQAIWFNGETAVIVVDTSYTGAVSASGRQIDGSGTVSFGGAQTATVKPAPPQSYWRYWDGPLNFSNAPGCYEIDLTGTNLRERVTVQVEAGSPPPG